MAISFRWVRTLLPKIDPFTILFSTKMKSSATSPESYIESLPDDRKKIIADMRNMILKNLPDGFKEGMGYGMISYCVPHSIYPPGYHVDPKQPLGLIMLASQKNHIALYHMALYSGYYLEWFQNEWKKVSTKKLDMGKACIRFKKPEDVPLKLIGELASKITPEQWVDMYEKALKLRP